MAIKTICTICDQEIDLDPGQVERAKLHQSETNGFLLIGCPNCCRVMVLPEEARTLKEEGADGENWLDCIPLMEPQLAAEPNGVNDYLGEKVYRPGDGSEQLRKWPYMLKFGVDPECMWQKMKPKYVSGSAKETQTGNINQYL